MWVEEDRRVYFVINPGWELDHARQCIVLTSYNRECLLPPHCRWHFLNIFYLRESVFSFVLLWYLSNQSSKQSESAPSLFYCMYSPRSQSQAGADPVWPRSAVSLVWVIISKSWALFCLDTARRPSAGQPAAADFYLMLEYTGRR